MKRSTYAMLCTLVLVSIAAAPVASVLEQPALTWSSLHGTQEITGARGALSIGQAKPKCDTGNEGDPDAPCYAEAFCTPSPANSGTAIDPFPSVRPLAASSTITCGVAVYNRVGQLVAKLWETFTATWAEYQWTESGASRGSWVLDSRYQWKNMGGPTPGSGTFKYNIDQKVKAWGDLYYILSNWGTYGVTVQVYDYQQWQCRKGLL